MENYEMIWIIITASISLMLSGYFGHKRLFYLHKISLRRIGFSAVIALSVFSLLLVLFRLGIMSEGIGAAIITNTYASLAGFFGGSALNQYRTKTSSGDILYAHRSFLADHAAVIMAIGIILFGIYRTSVFNDLAITPIRVTSGLSFIAFGLWGMTLRLVPEFRSKGIIILDHVIKWDDFLNYSWFYEEVVEVEYEEDETIRSFKTYIPPADQLEVEDLLRSKMMEKIEEDSMIN